MTGVSGRRLQEFCTGCWNRNRNYAHVFGCLGFLGYPVPVVAWLGNILQDYRFSSTQLSDNIQKKKLKKTTWSLTYIQN